MSSHEAERRDLWISLSSAIGETHADPLMTMLPPQPLTDLATRADLAALTATLQADLRASSEAVRSEFVERFATVDGQFAEVHRQFGAVHRQFGAVHRQFGELRGELGELRGELRELRGELRDEISRQILMLGLTLGSMMLAILGTLLTLGFTGTFN